MKTDTKIVQTVRPVIGATVEKASDEEKAIIGDMRALLDKWDQLENGEAAGAGEGPGEEQPAGGDDLLQMAMKAAEALGIGTDGEPEKPKDEEGKAAKSTASDPAEKRIDEDNPEANDAIKLIGKALQSLLTPQAKVAKSARSTIDQGVMQILGKVSEQLDVNTRAIEGILQGMGAVDIIEKAAKPAQRQVIQQSPNAAAELLGLILKSAGAQPGAQVRKGNGFDDYVPEEEGLASVLKSLGAAGVQQVGQGNS
jgi:hypothetical protein